MKKAAAPRLFDMLYVSSVGWITVDCAVRSHARQPHASGRLHGPLMKRPKSLALMTSQFDSAVSSMSNTTAGRGVSGTSAPIQAMACAATSARSCWYWPLLWYLMAAVLASPTLAGSPAVSATGSANARPDDPINRASDATAAATFRGGIVCSDMQRTINGSVDICADYSVCMPTGPW